MIYVEESTPKSPEADALDGKPSSGPLSSSWAQDDLEGWLQPSPGPTALLNTAQRGKFLMVSKPSFWLSLMLGKTCADVLFTC